MAPVSIDVLLPAPEAAVTFNLDDDPGWVTSGEWAFGQPTGGGSHDGDPSSGYTGDNVYGYNLDGDYTNDMPAYTLTTTAINCRNVQDAELRFWRWLGVEGADQATIHVSNDGLGWTPLWSNPGSDISDSAWSQVTFDISAVADGRPAVYVRWTMGPTDGETTYPGWNIDDVEIWGIVVPQCPGDLDGDNDIDLSDLAQLLGHYGMTTGATYGDGDIDDDGDVDLSDLAELLSVYGTSCS